MKEGLINSLAICLLCWSGFWLFAPAVARRRLEALSEEPQDKGPAIAGDAAVTLSALSDRLGAAGYLTRRERKRVIGILAVLTAVCTILGGAFGLQFGAPASIVGALCGIYLSATGVLYFLRWKAADCRRELLFQLPIVLESLVLLMESGLGILPAIERIAAVNENHSSRNPASRMFGLVYGLAASGLPLATALEMVADATPHRVLRHVFLHLDVTGSEGGRLAPAIRSLSDHAHQEWKLGVETRVRRLETFAVFPVFVAVLGLLLITAAVPLVPVLDFAQTLDSKRTIGQATE